MAIWQVSFNVIENSKKNNDEDICYWDKEPINAYDITFLKKCDSWTNDIIQYGDLQKTCIELLIENGKTVEVSVRLDLRTLTKELLINIVDYVIGLNANVYYQNEIVIPSVKNIINIIRNSDAYIYCGNPLKYIDDLNKEDNN